MKRYAAALPVRNDRIAAAAIQWKLGFNAFLPCNAALQACTIQCRPRRRQAMQSESETQQQQQEQQ